MKKKIYLKINKPLPGHPVGSTVPVDAAYGVPTDKYWRNRLKEAEIDKCVSVVSKPVVPVAPAAPVAAKTSTKVNTKAGEQND